jgi:hypothetical protein
LEQVEAAESLLDRIGDQGPHLTEAVKLTRRVG